MKNLFLRSVEKTTKTHSRNPGVSSIGCERKPSGRLALAGNGLILVENHIIHIGHAGEISHGITPLFFVSVVYYTKVDWESKGVEL